MTVQRQSTTATGTGTTSLAVPFASNVLAGSLVVVVAGSNAPGPGFGGFFTGFGVASWPTFQLDSGTFHFAAALAVTATNDLAVNYPFNSDFLACAFELTGVTAPLVVGTANATGTPTFDPSSGSGSAGWLSVIAWEQNATTFGSPATYAPTSFTDTNGTYAHLGQQYSPAAGGGNFHNYDAQIMWADIVSTGASKSVGHYPGSPPGGNGSQMFMGQAVTGRGWVVGAVTLN